MTITKDKCNHCGEEVENYFQHKGWFSFSPFNPDDDITCVSYVETPEDTGKKASKTINNRLQGDMHFCCELCLVEWLKCVHAERNKI